MCFDCGRNGELEGIFVAEKSDVEFLVEKKVGIHFGEVLGKHSDVYGYLSEDEIKMVSDEESVIKVVKEHGLETGYDPFEYPVWYDDLKNMPQCDFNWDDLTVYEYVRFMKDGEIPSYRKEKYEAWLSKQTNEKQE